MNREAVDVRDWGEGDRGAHNKHRNSIKLKRTLGGAKAESYRSIGGLLRVLVLGKKVFKRE